MKARDVLIATTGATARLHEREQAEQGKKPKQVEKENHQPIIGASPVTFSASVIDPPELPIGAVL